MNAQKYVAIEVIAAFKRVKQLTEDRAVIVEAVRQCKNCVLDDTATLVRPQQPQLLPATTSSAAKAERTTLILRDLPATTAEAELRALFDAEACPGKGKVTALRADIGDTWFVTFDSSEACQKTAIYLMSQKFQGKPIRCGVKSETRSLLTAPPAAGPNPYAGTGSITTPMGPGAMPGTTRN
jgi:hypothetical protein